MADEPLRRAVFAFNPRGDRLQAIVRRLAVDSGNVKFSRHAVERMEERDISTLDALRVLRIGDIVGEIRPGTNAGEWTCKVVAARRGGRDIGVVTLVVDGRHLLVKTVEWEDR